MQFSFRFSVVVVSTVHIDVPCLEIPNGTHKFCLAKSGKLPAKNKTRVGHLHNEIRNAVFAARSNHQPGWVSPGVKLSEMTWASTASGSIPLVIKALIASTISHFEL